MFPFVSHALVAGTGWALVMMARTPRTPPAPPRDPVAQDARQAPAKSRAGESGQGEGGRLLGKLMESAAATRDFRDVPAAPDRAEAARAALLGWSMNPADAALMHEACARLGHWLEVEPGPALLFCKDRIGFRGNPLAGPFIAVIASALEDSDPGTLASWFQPPALVSGGSTDALDRVLLTALGNGLARSGSASRLTDTLAGLGKAHQPVVLRQAIQSWPGDRLNALAPLLAGSTDTSAVVAYFQRLPAGQQLAWLRAEFAGDPPADPSRAMLLHALLSRSIAMPMDERIGWIGRLDAASGRTPANPATAERIVSMDVSDWLNRMNGDDTSLLGDWRHQLAHDQLTAGEILAAARQAMPDVAAREPELLLRTVFQHIARSAPEGAMGLLDELPAAEREKLMLATAFSAGGAADPQALLDLVSTLPPTTGSNANERFRVWVRAANPGVGRFGDSYGAWVMALPPGVERDMALSGLASHFDADDPQAAAAFRAAKTLPAGWRPGPK